MKKWATVWLFIAGLATMAGADTLGPSSSMNEFSGTISSIDSDAGTLRLDLEGGYSVEFSFDTKTSFSDAGRAIKAEELSYGDRVAARYIGKELYAKQIVRNPAAAGASDVAQSTANPSSPSSVSSGSAKTATP